MLMDLQNTLKEKANKQHHGANSSKKGFRKKQTEE